MLYEHGHITISVSTDYETFCTRSTVTDYLVRKIEITNQKTGQIALRKDKVLWRTTSQGLTGADLDINIKKVQMIKDGLIIINFSDGEEVKIMKTELKKPQEVPAPEFVKYCNLQINKEVHRLKEARKNLSIPVKSIFGERKYRNADVGRFGEIEFISKTMARITLWEEIDYRADQMYATQKRLITYVISPNGMKEESRETLGYE